MFHALHDGDKEYWRSSREAQFGCTLEEVRPGMHDRYVCAGAVLALQARLPGVYADAAAAQYAGDQSQHITELRTRMLRPMRATVAKFPFLGGSQPNIADILVASLFLVSALPACRPLCTPMPL